MDIIECIENIEIQIFPNKKRKDFINNNIKNIKNILEKIENNDLFIEMQKYYHDKSKLVEYLKIKNNENIIFVGDIHGDFDSMINAFSMFDDNSHIVFLGDIVDRGPNSLECIVMLMLYKAKYPERVHIIRGNHECNATSKIYGFYDEIKEKIKEKEKEDKFEEIYDKICDFFSHLPIIIIIQNSENLYRICGVHGCIDKETNLTKIENMEHILRNSFNECWNDPKNEIYNDEPSERGWGLYVGKKSILEWMKINHINCIFRSHEVIEKGYFFPFEDKSYIIHIFSQPNYCNFYNNKASIAIIENNFTKCCIYLYNDNYEDKYVNEYANKYKDKDKISDYF
jgi:hypothetical protein